MLVEFTVGNFCSFRDPATLSLVATKLTSQDEQVDFNNVFAVENQPSLLTSAAIYGANASGKSNLVEAMEFMRSFVIRSARETTSTGGIAANPFRLNPRTLQEPSHFEMTFLLEEVRYRYGFEATSERVTAEWLYRAPKKVESTLFERQVDEIKVGPSFREGRNLERHTRPNALFLSTVALLNGAEALRIVRWFRELRILWEDRLLPFSLMTQRKLATPASKAEIEAFIKQLDLSIIGLSVETTEVEAPLSSRFATTDLPGDSLISEQGPSASRTLRRTRIKTTHKIYEDTGEESGETAFDLRNDESAGTQKLFDFAGPLLDALQQGLVLVIDEFDARLHPTLTRELFKLFNNRMTNPRHAQLVFTCQDTNLLDQSLLRRDQIWFIEKDSKGASSLYSLAEFRGVRNDLQLERSYIQGRFGAVPYLGQLPYVVRESEAKYGSQSE